MATREQWIKNAQVEVVPLCQIHKIFASEGCSLRSPAPAACRRGDDYV